MQIVYYSFFGDRVHVYCDIKGKVRIVSKEQYEELAKAIGILNNVGCNISLRLVGD